LFPLFPTVVIFFQFPCSHPFSCHVTFNFQVLSGLIRLWLRHLTVTIVSTKCSTKKLNWQERQKCVYFQVLDRTQLPSDCVGELLANFPNVRTEILSRQLMHKSPSSNKKDTFRHFADFKHIPQNQLNVTARKGKREEVISRFLQNAKYKQGCALLI